MSEKIKALIAYDGSKDADMILQSLGSVGLPAGGVEVLVLSVAEVWLPPTNDHDESDFITEGLRRKHEKNLQIFKESSQLAEAAAERARTDFPAWEIRAESTYGSPAWEILARAEKFKSDLILVGSQGLSMLQRIWLGSVSQKVLTEAKCSVRIVRAKSPSADGKIRLIIGFDGTDGAEEAVKSVENRFWPAGTEVHIIIVEDNQVVLEALSMEEETGSIEKRGAGIVSRLEGKGLTAELEILRGNPKDLLVQRAADLGTNCIFVGATEFSGAVERFLLGSVSSAVATRAGCSVEVVR